MSKAKKATSFSPKDRIDHFVYGTGTIVELNDRHTTIDFDENGTRKFLTEVVKLSPSDTPAPAKRTTKKKTKASKASKAAKASTKVAKATKVTKAAKAAKK